MNALGWIWDLLIGIVETLWPARVRELRWNWDYLVRDVREVV